MRMHPRAVVAEKGLGHERGRLPLEPGDVVRCEIAGIGVIENRVAR